MKQILLLLSLMIVHGALFAQVVDPTPGFKTRKDSSIRYVEKLVIKEKTKNGVVKKDTSYVYKEVQEEVKERASFFGLTSLNNANNDVLNSLNGTGRLGASFKLTKMGRLKLNFGVNMLNAKPPKGISKDSIDFNSLQFPETGNFGFMFSPSFRLNSPGEHTLWLESSFAYRKVSVDSPSVSFKALSYNLGLKYQWLYLPASDSNHVIFTLMPYANFFNIPNEEVTKFKSLLNDPLFDKVNEGAGVWSVGSKITAQYRNVLFFFDIRYNFNTKEFNDDNPFKGTKVNIGFVTAFMFKSF